jgi:hypothetical protein
MDSPTLFQKQVASNLGNFPFIYYGSYQIDVQNIYSLYLYYKGAMPYLSISFYDTLNLMKDKAMPLDDAKIEIFFNPRSEQLKEIHIRFKITSFLVNEGRYNIEGVIDVDLLYCSQYKSYPNMTSSQALQEICREAGLGFNTNIDDTDDQMTWINTGNQVSDFMEDIVENSYKSDTTFLSGFIDYYYNYNFVDIEKELNRDITNQLGISDAALGEAVKEFAADANTEDIQNLLLTNDFSMVNTNLYFSSYKIVNNSTKISLESGYKNIAKYYDENQKDFLIFDIESITSQTPNSIILKGAPQDNNFYNLNVNTYYIGKFDSDNVHKNYKFAYIHNDKNNYDLEKIVLEINMGTPNYSIHKFQKIKVFVSNQTTTPSQDLVNNRLTGDWLIIDIGFVYTDKTFVQKIKLIRRELALSDEELLNEPPVAVTPPTGTNTTNPEVQNLQSNQVEPPANPTASVASVATSTTDFILTKQIWRLIYNGKINPKVIELMYNPMIALLKQYQIDTPVRIISFLSQVNIESNFLQNVEEVTSGTQYNNRADLGNNETDGPKYIGRGLIKILGKNKYTTLSQLLNRDFVNTPTLMAADNKTHISGSDTEEQLKNCIEVSIIYYLKLSTWGNLNDYADKMDITKPIDVISGGEIPPNSNAENNEQAVPEGTTKENNFGKTFYSSNKNLEIFTLICFGVNGGYDGYRDKINNWNEMRKYFI